MWLHVCLYSPRNCLEKQFLNKSIRCIGMVYWQTVVNASTSIWREVLKKSTDVEVPLKEAWLRCLHPPLNPLGRASQGTQFSDEPTQIEHNYIFNVEVYLHFFPYRLHAQSLTDTMIEARRPGVKSSGVRINFDAVKCVAKVQKLQPMHQYKYWYRQSKADGTRNVVWEASFPRKNSQ